MSKEIICDINECTGCCACLNICPTSAIEMLPNERGELCPRIQEEKCIHCNKCRQICPSINVIRKTQSKLCYAAWTKDLNDRIHCASGGVITGLSRFFIKEVGRVYSAFFEDGKFNFSSLNCENDLDICRGSRYVQAFVGGNFKNVKEDLLIGKNVLFIGTPCQIAGLKKYLKTDYSNLYTVDFVCHGVPPFEYLKQWHEKFSKEKCFSATFRGKNNYMLSFFDNKKLIYRKSSEYDFYFSAFLSNIIQRESCYSCQYASIERVADITVGDFWGIGKTENVPLGRASLVLINTQKGNLLWDKIREDFYYEKREIWEARKGNKQLNAPAVRNKERDLFLEKYRKYGFVQAIQSTSLKRRIKIIKLKNILFNPIRKMKKILGDKRR